MDQEILERILDKTYDLRCWKEQKSNLTLADVVELNRTYVTYMADRVFRSNPVFERVRSYAIPNQRVSGGDSIRFPIEYSSSTNAGGPELRTYPDCTCVYCTGTSSEREVRNI